MLLYVWRLVTIRRLPLVLGLSVRMAGFAKLVEHEPETEPRHNTNGDPAWPWPAVRNHGWPAHGDVSRWLGPDLAHVVARYQYVGPPHRYASIPLARRAPSCGPEDPLMCAAVVLCGFCCLLPSCCNHELGWSLQGALETNNPEVAWNALDRQWFRPRENFLCFPHRVSRLNPRGWVRSLVHGGYTSSAAVCMSQACGARPCTLRRVPADAAGAVRVVLPGPRPGRAALAR